MKIIISPAKKMKEDAEWLAPLGKPRFIAEVGEIVDYVSGLSFAEKRSLWGCNEKIAMLNAERFANFDFALANTPAILAYDGIQYQYMAPSVFEESQLDYVEENLKILSGLYGILRPMDGVYPYRLEMQAKARVRGCKDLYDFWGDKIYREVIDESRTVINLASKEYSKCVEKYLSPGDRFVTCVFGEIEEAPDGNKKLVQKGVYAKMARGEMVRYLAAIKAKCPEDLKAFNSIGYRYDDKLSTDTCYAFVK